MMPKGEDGGTSPLVADIDDTPDRNGGGEEALSATEDADDHGEVVIPRSNGDPLQDDDDLAALEYDRGEGGEKGQIGFEAENATEVAATQQEQQVRITIYRCWAWTTCYGFLLPFVAQLPITYFGTGLKGCGIPLRMPRMLTSYDLRNYHVWTHGVGLYGNLEVLYNPLRIPCYI